MKRVNRRVVGIGGDVTSQVDPEPEEPKNAARREERQVADEADDEMNEELAFDNEDEEVDERKNNKLDCLLSSYHTHLTSRITIMNILITIRLFACLVSYTIYIPYHYHDR